MRWKGEESGNKMITRLLLFSVFMTISVCEGARRSAQRRSDTARSSELYSPAPSAESLQVIAQAMGAAGFEHYTEGRPLVKRLIPADSQPDLDVVEYQGVIGKAGVDFPAYPNIPSTGFNCKNVPTGYYADLETDCQVFHICDTSRKISFLCPNGTIFSQSHLICDWWFKVDCASAPALYESSAEYYSNEQKKTHKITQSLSKNPNLQQITDTNRAESRRSSVNVPTATERLLRHRQRLQNENPIKATSRSNYQGLFDNFNPTQRTQSTTAYEKRRQNLVQLITNGFGNGPAKTTVPTYTPAPSYRSTAADHNSLREMQVAAESASFANNNNRQFLQDYNNKNYRPYPVYTPNLTPRPTKAKTNPNLTSLYDFRDKTLDQGTQETTTKRQVWSHDLTTKRPTLMPYTKSYTNSLERREPYTRPGVSLLKDFLQREKNKTLTTTQKPEVTKKSFENKNQTKFESLVKIETKNTFESATKIPHTTRNLYGFSTEPTISRSTSRSDLLSNDYLPQVTTEAYQERRDRLIRKLHLETFNYGTTASTAPTITEKFYGDLPNRPGLVVPPSLTPKTLHSLAIYYATALDNLSTTPPPEEETETTLPPFNEYQEQNLEESLPALFSKMTINKYSKLFNQGSNNAELLEEIKLDPNGTYNELAEDLSVQQSQNPLATSPQIRELAQVFTHALSAYLQDPVQFRKALSEIRPTHPTFGDMMTTPESYNTEATTTVNEDDDEILGFSDDNKISRPSLLSLRDGKALKISTAYPTIPTNYPTGPEQYNSQRLSSTETVPVSYQTTTPRNPFKCCGRISASYTSASTPAVLTTTPTTFINTATAKSNTVTAKDYESFITTTDSSYLALNYLNNNPTSKDSPYGQGVKPDSDSKPLSEYIEVTNLPTAWGVDSYDSTIAPITNAHTNQFESKKIRPTTYVPVTTPIYFTETDSVELENEEELQRAHSQSFLSPKDNAINNRHGKQLNANQLKVKKPSEELEVPSLPDEETTTFQTTTQPPQTTAAKIEELDVTTTAPNTGNVFTSPDNDKTTVEFQWSSTYDSWPSTALDPITVNDGLSQTNPVEIAEAAKQTNSWEANTVTTIATPKYSAVSEQTVSPSVHVEITTPSSLSDERISRYLRDPTSTEPNQDISTIADTVVEKAKEIMGGMNATTTEKLMNVMKKTKSKTVKRLILLLVQTCDDDHNTTAEASKRALLEALMAVSQKDMDEIATQELEEVPITTVDYESVSGDVRRTERRRPKSLNYDANAINSLSNPTTTENIRTTTETITEPVPTTQSTIRPAIHRGAKKFHTKTTSNEFKTTKVPFIDTPVAEPRVAPQGTELKGTSDTRALELLRSLYTIAARWG